MVGAQLHPLTRFPYRPRDCGTKARVRQARRSRIRVSWNWGVSYDVAMAAAGEGRGISSRFCYRILIDTDLAIADAVSLLGRRQRLIITFSCNGVSRVTWQAAAGKRGGGTQKSILFVTMYFDTDIDIADAVRQPGRRQNLRFIAPPSPPLSCAYVPRPPPFWQRRASDGSRCTPVQCRQRLVHLALSLFSSRFQPRVLVGAPQPCPWWRKRS